MTAASTFLLGVAAGAAVVVGGAKAWVYFQSRRLARYLRGDHKLSERAMRRLLAYIYNARPLVHAPHDSVCLDRGRPACGSLEPGETIALRYEDATCPVCRPEAAER